MATVDGITAARAQEIEDNSVVSAALVNGNLILTTGDGTEINVGLVVDTASITAHAGDVSSHGIASAIVGTTETQILSNKTLTTPTIDSFVNALHDHGSNTDGGGLVIGQANNPSPVTTLNQYTIIDAGAGEPKTMASITLAPGRWLILATCDGVTLATQTTTRFSYDLATTSPTLFNKQISMSSDTTAIAGGVSTHGWLVNASTATVSFNIIKNGTGASITNSTNGHLLAIRMG